MKNSNLIMQESSDQVSGIKTRQVNSFANVGSVLEPVILI
jgi:hypothetical protein